MIKSNLFKLFSLFFIVIAAQTLLSMVEGQIEDRSDNRYQARSAVEESWTGNQTILSTILSVPYEQANKVRIFDKELDKYVEEIVWSKKTAFVLPTQQKITSKLKHQTLSKGIYQVPVYTAQLNIKGNFNPKKIADLQNDPNIRLVGKAYISVGIEDSRGIAGIPTILIDKKSQEVKSGSALDFFLSGYHTAVDVNSISAGITFESSVLVKGMGRISFVATGKENTVDIASDWPHPSFDGAFLPVSRKISDTGYEANWQTGVFSTNIENTIKDCFVGTCDNIYASAFGVNHIQAVDIYLKSLRSVKYGLLVVIITFTIFVLYEVLSKNLRIHPISYGLTGMALAIFFLLLIALSEHMNFALSYWISTTACTSLIGYYVSHFSKSKRHGLAVFGLLNTFYLILFFIIRSEDHALLSGSILLFALLTIVMVVTRKVDWYQFGRRTD